MQVVVFFNDYFFQGDGAPAENKIEPQFMGTARESIKRHLYLRLHLEVDLVFVVLLLLALATRLYNLAEPQYIVLVSCFIFTSSKHFIDSVF